MARKPRVEYPGALYHVITWENQRQKIFNDDRDRTKYLELLAWLREVHLFRIHAYVLMLNHVHFAAGKWRRSAVTDYAEIGQRLYALGGKHFPHS